MSSLIGVLQKSGGQVRTVTSQAALIKNSGVWEKGVELGNKVQLNEVQKKYDEDYQKILFLKSSLHELYNIDPIKTRFATKIMHLVFYPFHQNFTLRNNTRFEPFRQHANIFFPFLEFLRDLLGVMVTTIKHSNKLIINVDIHLRMGSVASVVSGITDTLRLKPEPHHQDGDVVFRPCSLDQLLDRCGQHLIQAELPPPLPRIWSSPGSSSPPHTSTQSESGQYKERLATFCQSQLDYLRLNPVYFQVW